MFQPEKEVKFYINVPQGRGARLVMNSFAYKHAKIVGLHTHDITICNIIIITSKSRIVMHHVDRLSMLFVKKSILQDVAELNGEPHAILLLAKSVGTTTKDAILELCKEINFQYIPIDDNTTGVKIELSKNLSSSSLPSPSLYSGDAVPDDLLFHPDEEKLINIRVIESVIGKEAAALTKQYRVCLPFVFNGMGWNVMPSTEFLINTSHDLTKQEMNNFNPNDTYFEIVDKLLKFPAFLSGMQDPQRKEAFIQSAKTTARHLEHYLHKYNLYKIFKNNMLYVLKSKLSFTLSSEDKEWQEKLISALNNYSEAQDTFTPTYEDFKSKVKISKFKEYVEEKYQLLEHHLSVRQFHRSHTQDTASQAEKIKKYITNGVELMKSGNNKEAIALLKDASINAVRYLLENNAHLASALSQYATCLYRLEQYEDSIYYFERSIRLYKEYLNSSSATQARIDALQKGLEVCKSKANDAQAKEKVEAQISPSP